MTKKPFKGNDLCPPAIECINNEGHQQQITVGKPYHTLGLEYDRLTEEWKVRIFDDNIDSRTLSTKLFKTYKL